MSQLPPLHSQLTLAELPNSVSWARRHVVDVLQQWAVPASTTETARLIVSELATNATSHTTPEPDTTWFSSRPGRPRTFAVSLTLTDRKLEISVGDHDPTPPTLREAETEATSGRGLSIVAMLSSNWGYRLAPHGAGKAVWAILHLP
ncbi:ATP-binding protein [Streptomyces sp. NPDC048331]|uniref:ATP-binding protein n=1 Tax=Streptomyces sp. NPDC048331 TaxID=3365534 RepID=UPI00371A2884